MTCDVVTSGSAIEGAKANGSSRNPLLHRGMVLCRGVRCTRFSASFDVRAKIKEMLDVGAKRMAADSLNEADNELICEKATIHTLDGKPRQSVEPRSASHKANFWSFNKQTAITIDQAHQELLNAISRTKQLCSPR